eukprot:CAMPEP_0173458324 /NCGR_PEP_ID=MMETSP1357-20121228/59401_1 /TAXON_ID=77926 /ORGANISM="Hemiselmis rufescens, Strain PCC563" /LENGTH=84 /DNA_ID=CAMNT_0014425689 /DNA_START=4 /DNA_END=256 /DNA_ORIENTATION=+
MTRRSTAQAATLGRRSPRSARDRPRPQPPALPTETQKQQQAAASAQRFDIPRSGLRPAERVPPRATQTEQFVEIQTQQQLQVHW